MKRKENFQLLPKELHQLKYEAISVPQGSVRLVKKTQERKSSTCYLWITKGVTNSSPVPLKTRRQSNASSISCQNSSGIAAEVVSRGSRCASMDHTFTINDRLGEQADQGSAAVKSNTTPNYDIRFRTSVAMHNATVQQPLTTVSRNSNRTTVMLHSEAGFVGKHYVVPFHCPCPPLIAALAMQLPVVSCRGSTKQWRPCGHCTLL
ncbi:uncharacterized protein TNCV_630961 [Trichonephila clavipes]|nr:uncharacterized protein TNCV_630961 [Trichonephila clavipes]